MKVVLALVLAYAGHAVALSTSTAAASMRTRQSDLSPNQQALAKLPPFPRAWIPLASVYELDGRRPNKVEFMGQSYVCFQNDYDDDTSWTVLDDACPHRLAPLSEGRIIVTADNDDTVQEIRPKKLKTLGKGHRQLIECSYHGWAFRHDGSCARIPQATPELQARTFQNNPNCNVQNYSTRVVKNIIFAWLWPEDCLEYMQDAWRQPENMTESISEDHVITYTKDAPYGWDNLLENVGDMSHLPWVHHGQQGTRQDTVVMNITSLSDVSESGLQFSFDDRTMGYNRSGLIKFRAPFVMTIKSLLMPKTENADAAPFDIDTFMVPTKPGWSRLIICGGPGSGRTRGKTATSSGDISVTKKRKQSLLAKVFKILPIWLIHQLTSAVIDNDSLLLHHQERERAVRRGVDYDGYCMPSSADRAIAPLRRWILKYAHLPTLGEYPGKIVLPEPPANRKALFNRWDTHSDQCRHCHGALDGVKRWRRNTFVVMAAGIVFAKFIAARLAIVGSLFMLQLLGMVEKSIMQGSSELYKNA